MSQRSGLNYINIGEVAEQADCMDGYDEELQCGILDEDKVSSVIEVIDFKNLNFYCNLSFSLSPLNRT